MFTEDEIETVENWRGEQSKAAAKELSKVWDKYTGEDNSNNCFCNFQRRKAFITNFYEWFEDNK